MLHPPLDTTRITGESDAAWADRLVAAFAQRRREDPALTVEAFLCDPARWPSRYDVVLDLIVAEWEMCRDGGEPPRAEEFVRRFPAWEADIRGLVRLTDDALTDATPPVAGAESRDREGNEAILPAWLTADEPTCPIAFGPYRLVRLLGTGGMARVFLAESPAHAEPVAVKIPIPPLHGPAKHRPETDVARVRFEREARVMRSLDHPSLVKLLDVGEADGLPYIAMPFYPNGSVRDELKRRGVFEPDVAARLIADVARGLQHAYDRGILHGDLKPGNMLLGADGQVVVTDFGLALDLDEQLRLTRTGAISGTPYYLCPERVLGKPAEGEADITLAGEVFSLGVILYELLAGVPPFRGALVEVLAQIHEANAPALNAVRPGLPLALVAVCAKAMSKLPADRYPTMAAFADALDRLLVETAGRNRSPETTINWPPPKRRRNLWWAALVGIGLVAMVSGGVWLTRPKPQPPPPPKEEEGRTQTPPVAPPVLQPAGRQLVSKRKVIGIRGQLQLVHDDLTQLDAKDRPHKRYLSLMAVHDNPYLSDAEYSLHLDAVRLVLNRLSKAKLDVPIVPLGESGAVLRIDFRDLDWVADHEWRTLREAEPYGVRYDVVNPDESIRKLAGAMHKLAGGDPLFDNPIIRADWTAVAASESPLFDRLAGTDPGERKVKVFDLADAKNKALSEVRRLYWEFPVDGRAAAAELGLAGLKELNEFVPVSRDDWSENPKVFHEWVSKLRLGGSRAFQPAGK